MKIIKCILLLACFTFTIPVLNAKAGPEPNRPGTTEKKPTSNPAFRKADKACSSKCNVSAKEFIQETKRCISTFYKPETPVHDRAPYSLIDERCFSAASLQNFLLQLRCFRNCHDYDDCKFIADSVNEELTEVCNRTFPQWGFEHLISQCTQKMNSWKSALKTECRPKFK